MESIEQIRRDPRPLINLTKAGEVIDAPLGVLLRRLVDSNTPLFLQTPPDNHPSGNAEPSDADRRITQQLKEALGLMDIRVIDHVVVGSEGCKSFAELGYL